MRAENKISFAQYAVLVFLGLFSPITRLLPGTLASRGGMAGWLSPLIAFVPTLIYFAFVKKMFDGAGGDEGLGDIINRALGRRLGGVFAVVTAAWLSVYSGFILRSGVERLLSTIYSNAGKPFFLITMAAVCTAAALGEIRRQARAAHFFFLIFVAVMTAVLVFAVPNIEPGNIWPPNVTKLGGPAAAAVQVVNVMTTSLYAAFHLGSMRREERVMKRAAIWTASACIMISLMLAAIIGILGPELSKTVQYPFFVMIRNISFLRLVERIEPVIIVLWIITDYVFVSMLLSSAGEALKMMYGSRHVKIIVCALGSLAVSFLISDNAFEFKKISREIIPAANLIYTVGLIPMIYIIGRIKEKIKSKKR